MIARLKIASLGACCAVLFFANCTDSDDGPAAAGDDSGADGTTSKTDGSGGTNDGGGSGDTGGGSDTGSGNDTGAGDAGSDAVSDATADAAASGGFAIASPVSVFAVPVGFAGTTTQHVIVASSSAAISLRALANGALRGSTLGVGVTNNAIGAIGFQAQVNLADGGTRTDDTVQFFNATTQAASAWDNDSSAFGLTQILTPVSCTGCTYTDLTIGPVTVPPTGHTVLANPGGASPRAAYRYYDAGADLFVGSETQAARLKIASNGPHLPISAAQRGVTQHGLVVALPADAGTTGQIFVHDRTGADATHVATAGTSPKMVRCAEAVCIVPNSGSNNATVFTWNGTTTVANVSNVAVGTIPQGVDIKKSGANYVAVVANSAAGSVNVITLDANAGVVSNNTVTLTGCANPRSVSHVPGTQTFAVACTTDNKIVVGSL